MLESHGEALSARVIRRSKGADGRNIGQAHENQLFDTRLYTVEFPDKNLGEYLAYIIAENLYLQIDSKGYQYAIKIPSYNEHFMIYPFSFIIWICGCIFLYNFDTCDLILSNFNTD